MSEDREAQEDELLALASIYDEEEFHRAEAAQGGEIQLCLELPAAFKVVVKGTALSGHPVVHRVERVPWRLSPDRRDPGLIPAHRLLLHVFPSLSQTFLSISLYHKA